MTEEPCQTRPVEKFKIRFFEFRVKIQFLLFLAAANHQEPVARGDDQEDSVHEHHDLKGDEAVLDGTNIRLEITVETEFEVDEAGGPDTVEHRRVGHQDGEGQQQHDVGRTNHWSDGHFKFSNLYF